jgi:hypothetical protein
MATEQLGGVFPSPRLWPVHDTPPPAEVSVERAYAETAFAPEDEDNSAAAAAYVIVSAGITLVAILVALLIYLL